MVDDLTECGRSYENDHGTEEINGKIVCPVEGLFSIKTTMCASEGYSLN